jgi:hypothetical protein
VRRVLDKPLRKRALTKLDYLINRLRHGPNPLLLERLQSARTYLLGARSDEYEFGLQTAKETAAG